MTAQSPELIHRRRWWSLAVLCLSLLIIVLDNTIVNVALPTLATKLGASNSGLQWIVDAYTLVFAGLLLTAGSLGDRYGRKGALAAGLVVFAVGSGAASLASSTGQLIAARSLMGVGGALIMPATLSILINIFTDAKERAGAIAIWAAVSGLAVALGPTVGGLLLDHFWWGSVFFINIPVVAVALFAGNRLLPTSRDPEADHLDVVGAALSIVGLGVLVWTIIEAPGMGWTSPGTVAGFAASIALLAGFVAYELRQSHPMLEIRFFRNARFTAASTSVMLMFFALMGFVFLLSQYLQFVRGYSPLAAGVRMLPFAVAVMIVAPVSARIVERIGTKLAVAVGMVMFSAAMALMWTVGIETNYWIVAAYAALMGAGFGLSAAPATESVMGSLPTARAGVGSAVNDTTRELGGTLGVAVAGSVFSSLYASGLESSDVAKALPAPALHAAGDSVGAAVAVADRVGGEPGRLLVAARRSSFIDGFHAAALVTAGVALVGAWVAWRFLPARAVENAEPGIVVVLAESGEQASAAGAEVTTAGW